MSDKDKAADFLLEMLKKQGVACSTTKDGHILMFQRKFLQAMLDKDPDKEDFVILVQKQEFKN